MCAGRALVHHINYTFPSVQLCICACNWSYTHTLTHGGKRNGGEWNRKEDTHTHKPRWKWQPKSIKRDFSLHALGHLDRWLSQKLSTYMIDLHCQQRQRTNETWIHFQRKKEMKKKMRIEDTARHTANSVVRTESWNRQERARQPEPARDERWHTQRNKVTAAVAVAALAVAAAATDASTVNGLEN